MESDIMSNSANPDSDIMESDRMSNSANPESDRMDSDNMSLDVKKFRGDTKRSIACT
jgi:hypothetical protein